MESGGSDTFDLILLGAAGSGGARERELSIGAVGYVLLEFGLEFGNILGDDSAVVADEITENIYFTDGTLGDAFIENLFEVGVLADRLNVKRLYLFGNQV